MNTSCHASGDEAEGRSRTSSLTLRAAALIEGIDEDADVLVGGEGHPKGLEAGYFVKPTVFVNVKNDMTIAREEIFGPVLCVIAYENDEDAVRIANHTDFGLHAYVSGTDLKRARRVASQLLAGRSKRLDRAFEAEAKHERTCR